MQSSPCRCSSVAVIGSLTIGGIMATWFALIFATTLSLTAILSLLREALQKKALASFYVPLYEHEVRNLGRAKKLFGAIVGVYYMIMISFFSPEETTNATLVMAGIAAIAIFLLSEKLFEALSPSKEYQARCLTLPGGLTPFQTFLWLNPGVAYFFCSFSEPSKRYGNMTTFADLRDVLEGLRMTHAKKGETKIFSRIRNHLDSVEQALISRIEEDLGSDRPELRDSARGAALVINPIGKDMLSSRTKAGLIEWYIRKYPEPERGRGWPYFAEETKGEILSEVSELILQPAAG